MTVCVHGAEGNECTRIVGMEWYSRACVTNSDPVCQTKLKCVRGGLCVGGVLRFCEAGYWADQTSLECVVCPLGSFCQLGVPVVCPAGATTSIIGATSSDFCVCSSNLVRRSMGATEVGFACVHEEVIRTSTAASGAHETLVSENDHSDDLRIIMAHQGGKMGIRHVGCDAVDANCVDVNMDARFPFFMAFPHTSVLTSGIRVLGSVFVLDTTAFDIRMHLVAQVPESEPTAVATTDKLSNVTQVAQVTQQEPGDEADMPTKLFSVHIPVRGTAVEEQDMNRFTLHIVLATVHVSLPDAKGDHMVEARIMLQDVGRAVVYLGKFVMRLIARTGTLSLDNALGSGEEA